MASCAAGWLNAAPEGAVRRRAIDGEAWRHGARRPHAKSRCLPVASRQLRTEERAIAAAFFKAPIGSGDKDRSYGRFSLLMPS